MLNEGVLNLTLNESPEPNTSVIDPVLEAGAGLGAACTGAGLGAGLRGAGAGMEFWRDTAGLEANLEEPETALDTVCEIRGEMLDTTWDTMSLELKLDEPELNPLLDEPELNPLLDEPELNPVLDEPVLNPLLDKPALVRVEVVRGGGAIGRLLLPPTALDTVEEIKGEILETTWATMSLELKLDEPELNPLLDEPELNPVLDEPELNPLLEELDDPELNPESEKEELPELLDVLTGLGLISI